MSSNIRVKRICTFCNNEFVAKTTVTKFCSHNCSRKSYKAKLRNSKIDKSNNETINAVLKPIEQLNAKEFLTVNEVAQLLNCSKRSVYHYIDNDLIKAVNLGQRMTRVRRADINNIFEKQEINAESSKTGIKDLEIKDCYNLKEIQIKYRVSESTVRQLVIRNKIPKLRKGKFAYVPKTIIDKLLKKPTNNGN